MGHNQMRWCPGVLTIILIILTILTIKVLNLNFAAGERRFIVVYTRRVPGHNAVLTNSIGGLLLDDTMPDWVLPDDVTPDEIKLDSVLLVGL